MVRSARLFMLSAGALMLFGTANGGTPAPCRLCAPAPERTATAPEPSVPLRIDVEASLDFSRVALDSGGGGEVVMDADGGRRVSGGLRDMGGLALRGTARIHGRPNAAIRVDVPTRVNLRTATGATAEVIDIRTDLSPAPRLDGAGQLSFSFGGRLILKGQISGTFRGNIPITADYE